MGSNARCGCCGLIDCVCSDAAFEDCVRERDRDEIIALIARCRRGEAECERLRQRIRQVDADQAAGLISERFEA